MGPAGAGDPRTATALLSLAVGIVLADSAIVTLALPQILRDLDTEVAQVAWVLIAYNLVLAVAAVPAARLSVRTGRSPVAGATGLVVFAAASAGCALSSTLEALVAARVVQALGGALVITACLELLVVADGDERRGAGRSRATGAAERPAAPIPTVAASVSSATNKLMAPYIFVTRPKPRRATLVGRANAHIDDTYPAAPRFFRRTTLQVISCLAVVALLMASAAAAEAAPPAAQATATPAVVAPASPLMGTDAARQADLERALRFVASIPRSVLARGQSAVDRYVAKHRKAVLPRHRRAALRDFLGIGKFVSDTAGVVKCGAAITLAIASAGIPVAKLLKLKAFIKSVGSAREAASLLIRVATGTEKIEQLSPALASLAGEVLGIDAIKKACG